MDLQLDFVYNSLSSYSRSRRNIMYVLEVVNQLLVYFVFFETSEHRRAYNNNNK